MTARDAFTCSAKGPSAAGGASGGGEGGGAQATLGPAGWPEALAAARKKTSEMTEEEKAAETALNQQLLVAKGVLFAAVIGYFAFTSL